MKTRRIAPVVLLGLVLAGCADVTRPSQLLGEPWYLASLRGPTATQRPADPTRYTITFDGANRISVRADCNSCGGRYTLAGNSFAVSDLACTLVHCGESSLDQPFVALLTAATTVDVDGDRMTLSSDRGTLELTRSSSPYGPSPAPAGTSAAPGPRP